MFCLRFGNTCPFRSRSRRPNVCPSNEIATFALVAIGHLHGMMIYHTMFVRNQKLSAPNAQVKLRGLMTSRRAAVSSSLWLGALPFLWLYRDLCRVPYSHYPYGLIFNAVEKSIR